MTAKIFDQLDSAATTLRHVREEEEIAHQLAKFGYGLAKLAQGDSVLEAAHQARRAQRHAKAELVFATIQTRKMRTAAWAAYQRIATMARAILPAADPLLLTHLGLQHAMPRGANDFLAAATHLFEGITKTPEIATLLTEYGYDRTIRSAEEAHIAAYRAALQEQQSATAFARRATRAQQAALQSLARWMAQFHKVASVAFYDDPTSLIMLAKPKPRRKHKDAEDAPNEEINNEEAAPAETLAEAAEEPEMRLDMPAEGDQPSSTPSDHSNDQDPSKQQK